MSEILSIFPTASPVYSVVRQGSQKKEIEEIESIISEGMNENIWQSQPSPFNGNSSSVNKNILDLYFQELRIFCETHIRKYVEGVICPLNKSLEFFITQSWLNVNKPNTAHEVHVHQNSLISGVYYFTNDCIIRFRKPFQQSQQTIHIEPDPEALNLWNSFIRDYITLNSKERSLILFPSWLQHEVPINTSSSDRISISFNVFVRGNIGNKETPNYLELK